MDSQKLVMLKTGWSDLYDGDEVTGNFGYVEENGPNSGHERFNFRRAADGLYRGYLPPMGGHYSTPKPPDPGNWTVVWVSKKPGTTGVRIVGVYFGATFSPERENYEVAGETIGYCVSAPDGFVVPSALRTVSFPSPIRSAHCCYVRGGDNDFKYRKLAVYLTKEIERIRAEVEADAGNHAGRIGFPTNEHIRKVENAAVDYVRNYFESRGYVIRDRQKENVGYDLEARSSKSRLFLEVKGTSGSTLYAYITANELATTRGGAADVWRMCMVTNALTTPKLTVFNAQDFLAKFSLEPICYRAVTKPR